MVFSYCGSMDGLSIQWSGWSGYNSLTSFFGNQEKVVKKLLGRFPVRVITLSCPTIFMVINLLHGSAVGTKVSGHN